MTGIVKLHQSMIFVFCVYALRDLFSVTSGRHQSRFLCAREPCREATLTVYVSAEKNPSRHHCRISFCGAFCLGVGGAKYSWKVLALCFFAVSYACLYSHYGLAVYQSVLL